MRQEIVKKINLYAKRMTFAQDHEANLLRPMRRFDPERMRIRQVFENVYRKLEDKLCSHTAIEPKTKR